MSPPAQSSESERDIPPIYQTKGPKEPGSKLRGRRGRPPMATRLSLAATTSARIISSVISRVTDLELLVEGIFLASIGIDFKAI